MRNIIIILLVSYQSFSFAQHPGFSKLYHYSGDTSAIPDLINSLLYDSISQKIFFHITGYPRANTGYRTPSVFFRIDLAGNVEKEHLDTLSNGNMLYGALALSRDGKYLYWGGCRSAQPPGSAMGFYVLTKTDKDLNVLWRKSYPFENALDGYTIDVKTNPDDDNLVLLCSKFTEPGNSLGLPTLPGSVYIRRLDSAGNLLEVLNPGPTYYNNPSGIAIKGNGDYLVCGRTFSWGQEGTFFLMNVNENGTEDWHQFYLQEHDAIFPKQMIRSRGPIEEYVVTGQHLPSNSEQGQAFINKIDGDGNELWSKTLQADTSFTNATWAISNAKSGGYIVGGSVRSTQRPYGPQPLAPNGWLVRFDNDGNEIWNKSVTAFPLDRYHEYIYKVVALPDGGFVAAGSSWGQNASGYWNQEGWVVRVDSNGCMNPECLGNILSTKGAHAASQNFNIYPNPATDHVIIENSVSFSSGTNLSVFDNLGRKLNAVAAPTGQRSLRYNLAGLAPGIYYIQIESKGQYARKKLTVIK